MTDISLLKIAKEDTTLDQGNIGSCWANAISSALSLITRQSGEVLAPISRMKYYEDCRVLANQFNSDAGVVPLFGKQAAMTKGFAAETSWEYTRGNLFTHAPASVTYEASTNLVSGFTDIKMSQNATSFARDVKLMLDEGKPVILAFRPQYYFFNASGPLQSQVNYGNDGYTAGHAVVIVAANDNLNGGSYIVKNSWGHGWGDGGYGVIKYTQFGITSDLIGMYTINGFDGRDYVYSQSRLDVNRAYVTLLERPADIGGLDWWVSLKASKSAIANAMINSEEGKLIYGSLSNYEFVEKMYDVIVDRKGADAEVSYWASMIGNTATRGDIAIAIADAVWSNPAESNGYNLLRNKMDVANYISIACQYDGSKDSVVKNYLDRVGYNEDVTNVLKIGIQDSLYPVIG